MIKATPEPLAEATQESLRQWLNKKEFTTLLKVIEAKGKVHLADMAEKAIDSKDFGRKLDGADTELKAAQKYAICLEVLEEISQQTEPFTTVKLT